MSRVTLLPALMLSAVAYAQTDPSPAYGAHAADTHFDPAAMARVRADVHRHHGGTRYFNLLTDRLELVSGEESAVLWDLQGLYGGSLHRMAIKLEGEAELSDAVEHSELQALYSRAVRPFWDLQAGLRQDVKPDPDRTYAVLGLQGIAPYWFEVDTALFLSDQGDLSFRLEVEYELRLTQRWLLQPRIELDMAFSDDPEIGVGSGLSTLDAGLRLRYEITRELAPYIGISLVRAYGQTADLADDPERFSAVAGLRFRF